jgi:hypothetical protein
MKIVKENINFERTKDSFSKLQIGLKTWDEIENGDILRLKTDIVIPPYGEFYAKVNKNDKNINIKKGTYFIIGRIEEFKKEKFKAVFHTYNSLEDLKNPTFENQTTFLFYAPLQRFKKNFEILSTR